MTEDTTELVRASELLTAEVERAAKRQLRGAELAVLYQRHFPQLRERMPLGRLLDEHAGRLTILGRAGSDWLWGFEGDDDAPEVDLELFREQHPALAPAEGADPEGVVLEKARFVSYRVLRDVTIELGNLTVLVGPNGSGKSSLLDGLHRSSLLMSRKPLVVFAGPNALDRVHTRGFAGGLGIELRGSDGYSVAFSSGPLDSPDPRFSARAGGEPVAALPSLLRTPLQRAFGGASLLRLSARQLARPSYSQHLEPYLRHDGFYLPSVIAWVAAEDRERLGRILEGVRAVIPSVRDLRAPRVELPSPQGEPVIGNRLEVKFGDTGWTPADQLSEGTLLTLGLHTLLSRPSPPRLLLFDDVERGLHPSAQRRLIAQLKELAAPRRQIVCSTHSPYVIDPLDADIIRVIRPGNDGYACLTALTKHADWQQWNSTMSAGEFWQLVGDEWLEEAV